MSYLIINIEDKNFTSSDFPESSVEELAKYISGLVASKDTVYVELESGDYLVLRKEMLGKAIITVHK